MIDLPKPGTYVVRSSDAEGLSKALVRYWLDSPEETQFKACLWLTVLPAAQVQDFLQPYLAQGGKAIRGLDVISSRRMLAVGNSASSIRLLCRSLDTLLVLRPALVIIDQPQLWFGDHQEPLGQRNPMAKMRLLRQWAQQAGAQVVLPVQEDLPQWSSFASGLAEVNEQADFEFRPWWPTPWGVQSSLWNEPGEFFRLGTHLLLDSRDTTNLKQLARVCHQLRFGPHATTAQAVHVQAHGEINEQEASVLLRMGADTVWLKQEKIYTWLGLSEKQIQRVDVADLFENPPDKHLARDLHEVFMPGFLTVVNNPAFATQGLMMLKVAQRWAMHCSLTRLSLMPHVTARTALRLANWGHATCVFTATREAVYLLKIWETEPEEPAYREWLESCFRERLTVLFSGDIQLVGEEQQAGLLADLHEELEPLSVEDLVKEDPTEHGRLDELWNRIADRPETGRPWLARLGSALANTASGVQK